MKKDTIIAWIKLLMIEFAVFIQEFLLKPSKPEQTSVKRLKAGIWTLSQVSGDSRIGFNCLYDSLDATKSWKDAFFVSNHCRGHVENHQIGPGKQKIDSKGKTMHSKSSTTFTRWVGFQLRVLPSHTCWSASLFWLHGQQLCARKTPYWLEPSNSEGKRSALWGLYTWQLSWAGIWTHPCHFIPDRHHFVEVPLKVQTGINDAIALGLGQIVLSLQFELSFISSNPNWGVWSHKLGNQFSLTYLARYLAMEMLWGILTPSTVKYGSWPKGDSSRPAGQSSIRLSVYSILAAANMRRESSARPRALK